MPRLTTVGRVIGTVSLSFGFSPLQAQPNPVAAEARDDTVMLRPLGPHINEKVIRYVARNSLPFTVSDAQFDSGTAPNARTVIGRLCGSFRSEYYAEFLRANQMRWVDPNARLAKKPSKHTWPACLYYDTRNQMTTLRPGDAPANLYARLTGAAGSEEGAERYFGASDAELRKSAGKPLRVPYVTAAVQIKPKELTPQAFLHGLAKAATEPNRPPQAMVREIPMPSTTGEIVVALSNTTLKESGGCKPFAQPFDATAVERAYKFAVDRAKAAGIASGQAQVFIVDNGFFGADSRKKTGEEFENSPFAKEFFARDDTTVIAKLLEMNSKMHPIIFGKFDTPDTISGHGTHVTGLVLGGPGFQQYRSTLRSEPWLNVSVLNFGNGSQRLESGADGHLESEFARISTPLIVNLSIAYDARQSNEIKSRFLALADTRHLFIVSAGNSGRDVIRDSIYPAALGGFATERFITVAALDADGGLTRFTNLSAQAVDLAAPGCGIVSWIRNAKDEVAMSGTSQAAPLVTFAASLLRSLAPNVDLRHVKARLVSSGDLLRPEDQDSTAYRVRLNIPKALYWSRDYVAFKGPRVGEYLGEIRALGDIKCTQMPTASAMNNVWAFKRGARKSWLYYGRQALKVLQPCEVAVGQTARLEFVPAYRILPSGFEEMKGTETWRENLDDVEEIVVKTPLKR